MYALCLDDAEHDGVPDDGDAGPPGHRPDPDHQHVLRHRDDPHHGRHRDGRVDTEDPPRRQTGSRRPGLSQIYRSVIMTRLVHSKSEMMDTSTLDLEWSTRNISYKDFLFSEFSLSRWLAIFTFSSYPPTQKQLENLEKGLYRLTGMFSDFTN